MKNLKLAVWIFLIFLVQAVFSVFLEIGGTVPELLYVFTLSYAFVEKKPVNYITVGIVCAFLAESVSGGGINLLTYIVSIFMLIFVSGVIYKDIPLLILPLVFVFTMFKESVYYLLNRDVFESIKYADALKNVIIPAGVYNAIVALFMKKLLTVTVFPKRKRRR